MYANTMLSRRHRFHRRNQVRFVLARGQRLRRPGLTLHVIQRPATQSGFRVGVVVSRKISKLSPVRNRIRRRIYGIYSLTPPPDGTDVIVVVHDVALATVDASELQAALKIGQT